MGQLNVLAAMRGKESSTAAGVSRDEFRRKFVHVNHEPELRPLAGRNAVPFFPTKSVAMSWTFAIVSRITYS